MGRVAYGEAHSRSSESGFSQKTATDLVLLWKFCIDKLCSLTHRSWSRYQQDGPLYRVCGHSPFFSVGFALKAVVSAAEGATDGTVGVRHFDLKQMTRKKRGTRQLTGSLLPSAVPPLAVLGSAGVRYGYQPNSTYWHGSNCMFLRQG